MKNFRIERLKSLSLAALLMAGAAFAACSSYDNAIEQPASHAAEQVYTLTIKATNGGASTRGLELYDNPDDATKEKWLRAKWEEGDKLDVTKGTTKLTSTLECTAVNDNIATFSGTISGEHISDGDDLTLHYHMPAGLSNFASQDGTLASAANRDYATATIKVSVNETTHEITIDNDEVDFKTQTAVLKLTLQDGSSNKINATKLKLLSATKTGSGMPVRAVEIATFTLPTSTYTTNGAGVLYFALPQASFLAEYLAKNSDEHLTLFYIATYDGEINADIYTATKSGYSFEGGKYYTGTLEMTKHYTALTWNGGSTAWSQYDSKKNWLVNTNVNTDDFWNGDCVTFTDRNAGTVTLNLDLAPETMTVTGGEYTFEGDGRLNVSGKLTVSGGDVRIAREISSKNGELSGSGTKLTLEQTLRITGAFAQNGGTLIVDLGRLNGAAALSGEGKAELNIESGALELVGDTATPEGNTYTIASGFGSIAKAWENVNVSGQAEGRNVKYTVISEDTSVRVCVTCDEEPKPEPIPNPEEPVPVTP